MPMGVVCQLSILDAVNVDGKRTERFYRPVQLGHDGFFYNRFLREFKYYHPVVYIGYTILSQ